MPDATDLRERLRKPSLRKCEPSSACPYKTRAKRLYEELVERNGGYLPTARLEDVDESTVRLRVHHPKKHPPLGAIYSMTPEQMRRAAEDILDAADEKERVRRVG